jgi:IS30 family transposase
MDSRRYRLTRPEKKALWEHWKSGQSIPEIARSLQRHASSIRETVASYGGIAPAPRQRSERVLSLADREQISRGLAAGESYRQIGLQLGRATSTVSREVVRNGGRTSYRAVRADTRAWMAAKRPKPCRMAVSTALRDTVAEKLSMDWSPTQIGAWLKLEHPDQPSLRVSHETIYRTLFIQARGALRKELSAHLRSQRTLRRAQLAPAVPPGRGQIKDAVTIRERPAEAQDRAVPGHWEGDLIVGANNSYVSTLVERHTRFVMLVKVKGKDTQSVVGALAKKVKTLPEALRKSLTWDRGTEMAAHKDFTVATDVKVYFCDPRSPWQRGSNENTNGLLRQYLPRNKDLSVFSQRRLDEIAQQLNERPRQTLGWRSPAGKLADCVAMTG